VNLHKTIKTKHDGGEKGGDEGWKQLKKKKGKKVKKQMELQTIRRKGRIGP
jgi:hypothetical protein